MFGGLFIPQMCPPFLCICTCSLQCSSLVPICINSHKGGRYSLEFDPLCKYDDLDIWEVLLASASFFKQWWSKKFTGTANGWISRQHPYWNALIDEWTPRHRLSFEFPLQRFAYFLSCFMHKYSKISMLEHHHPYISSRGTTTVGPLCWIIQARKEGLIS